MPFFRALLTWSLLLIASVVCFAVTARDLPFASPGWAGSEANLEVSHSSPALTSLAVREPTLITGEIVEDYKTFRSYHIAGEATIAEDGKPALPQISRFCRIPNTGGMDIVLTNTDFELIENVDILPYTEEGTAFGTRPRDLSIYEADSWYPPQPAVVSAPMQMRDFRVVTVSMYPVQYNPVKRQVRIYHNLSADVVANDLPGENEILNTRRPTGSWASIYRNMISNLDELDLFDMTTEPGSYLIMATTDTLPRKWADSLYVWKTRKGFRTVVERRGNWTVQSMQQYIQTAYATWNPPLEFVCLMGDPSPTTSWGMPTGGSWSDFDHPFALGNNGDQLEDIGVGRLSGKSNDEMAVINAKIMGYERNPYMTDTTWYHKGFFYATINPPSGTPIASNYTLMQWAAQQYSLYTGVRNNNVQHVTSGVNAQTITQQINGGVSFFFWRGSWVGDMPNTVAGQTNPGWRLPVCLMITCSAGNFVGQDGVSESWLTAGSVTNPKGGVCAVGSATTSTHNPPNICVTGGMIHAIADLGIETPGHALNSAKAWLSLTWGPTHEFVNQFSSFNNLLGDPGLSMWTDVPKVINVDCPSSLDVGAHQVDIDVRIAADNMPVDSALVVLWKRGADSTWIRGLTDATGHVRLPVVINQPGDLLVTVTKRNHKPWLATVPCAAGGIVPTVFSTMLDDDNNSGTSGNGNGQLNPGETIDIPVTIKNYGTSGTATGMTAVLTSDNPKVIVINNSTTYPDLAPGETAAGAAPFRIQVAPDLQNGEQTLFTLSITAASGTTAGSFAVTCAAPAVRYARQVITGGPFGPGLTRELAVTVINNGTVSWDGATAHLASLSPFVVVNNPDADFGTIAAGARDSNATNPFTISASPLAFRGHTAAMRMILSTPGGFSDSIQFSISVGTLTQTDPVGPDAFGYYAYDNTDTSYEMHPTFNYVNISSGLGTNLNIADPGEKQVLTPVYSTVTSLPFTFRFYGRDYNAVTICANGWLAFGDQAWYDVFRNYPIPAMQAPEAMIAPYWDDLKTSGSNLGVWKYFDEANHRFIVQWKAQGAFQATNLDFEVILTDVNYDPSMDGNGHILVQYQTVTMNLTGDTYEPNGCTIGIQAPRNRVGVPYVYGTGYSPGAATVNNGRAILFTTDARVLFGTIAGTVTEASTGAPLPGALVSLAGYVNTTVSDSDGRYELSDILIGSYFVRCDLPGYNPLYFNDVLVELNDTTTLDFTLTHPQMVLSTDSIIAMTTGEIVEHNLDMVNNGDGPFDYLVSIHYGGDGNPSPWDSVGGIAASEITQDTQLQGCEFAWGQWWVTGGSGPGGENRIYRFDREGRLLGSIPQPSTSSLGWFDMAFDGQYLYGSDGSNLIGIDSTGAVQRTIPSPISPARALAWDPEFEHFWVTDYMQSIREIDYDGNVFRTLAAGGSEDSLLISGLAWFANDPDGLNLYAFSQTTGASQLRLTRLHPTTGARTTILDFGGDPEDRSGGCTITPGWNSTLLVFASIVQGATGDHLNIYEMAFNTSWISVIPARGDVPGGETQQLTLTMDPTILDPGTYRVNLRIRCDVLDTVYTIPVRLEVGTSPTGPRAEDLTPNAYSLAQNYPNPFNPGTVIHYELKNAGWTRLGIYNLLGEKVADLVDGVQAAGAYRLNFDAAALPTGVYFYRLESGDFVQTRKMILLK